MSCIFQFEKLSALSVIKSYLTDKFTRLPESFLSVQIHAPRTCLYCISMICLIALVTTLWLFYDNTNISAVNKVIEEGEVDLHNDSRMRRNGSLSLNFNSFYFKSKRR